MAGRAHDPPKPAATPTAGVKELNVVRDRKIVLVTLTNRTDADQQRASDDVCDAILRQRGPFAVIMDMRSLSVYPATQREMYAKGRARVRDVYERFHRITVYVVDDERQRGFVTAIGWKVPSVQNAAPRIFVSNLADAQAKCLAALVDP